ncbi:MAG: hypothetical protein CL918_01850 [Deltaproteobacteria bacterium]|nr:hypothetical protein [Deltaproteobacteria bacterium]|tara:strand:+ start:1347 stop:1538 length:192 start_codon:yes stop_codon:yes gene_type:complete
MFSEAGLAAIEEAIAGGFLRVKYEDKEVWYRDLNELLKTRDLIRKRLGSGTTTRKFASFKKDY